MAADALRGRFQVLLAEAMDRLAREQACSLGSSAGDRFGQPLQPTDDAPRAVIFGNRVETAIAARSQLPDRTKCQHRGAMDDTLLATITAVIARAPEWIRHDLLSKETSIRTRAEETLAAMIANALPEIDGV